MATQSRPFSPFRNLNAKFAAIPMILTTLVVFVGGTLWTVLYSFTNSKLLPRLNFVGFDQYERLWETSRWLISIKNLLIYGSLSLVFTMLMGFLLAALMDQKIRFEDTFRTIMLYPFALSFIVTGLVWQWILNPDFGIQSIVRALGLGKLHLRSAQQSQCRALRPADRRACGRERASSCASCWRACAASTRRSGRPRASTAFPTWKTYLFIVVPMMRPVFITTLVIVAVGHHPALRSGGGADFRRAGQCEPGARHVCLRLHVPGAEPRPGFCRLDHDADLGADRARSLGLSRVRRQEAWLIRNASALVATDADPGNWNFRSQGRASAPRDLARQHHALRHR